jgi:hypothetical protein
MLIVFSYVATVVTLFAVIFYVYSRQDLASALERDNDCSENNSPDITKVSVGSLVTKLYGT